MMKKKIDSPFRKLRVLLVLPLVALVFYAFAKPEYITSEPATSADQITTITEALKELSVPVNVPANKPSKVVRNKVVQNEEIKIVKGNVVNPDGKPLAGAAVIIKGTSTGTTTDRDGNFQFKDVPEDRKLVISFVGYATAEVKPDFEKSMAITMAKQNVGIDGVVVVGYGKDKIPPPAPQTGIKIDSIDSKNPPLYVIDGVITDKRRAEYFLEVGVESVNVLKGKSATDKYGEKGKYGVCEITLKKSHSVPPPPPPFDAKNPPLYILDGEIINHVEMIKPDDIESIDVLKGKSGTDLYGEKGKNGVILITSKKKGVTVVGYGKMSDSKIPSSPLGFNIRTIDTENPPLIFFDGAIIDKAKMDAINPDDIKSIKVMKDENATEKYGEKGKNGVILITSKKKDVTVVGYGKTSDLKIPSSSLGFNIRTIDTENPPLIMLDGLIIDKGRMEAIGADNIESITVLKDKQATSIYGEKGKDGVILITSKKKGIQNKLTDGTKTISSQSGDTVSQKKNSAVFVVVEQMPEFPGGALALRRIIAQSVKYPVEAQKNGIVGKVFVTFVVNSNGKVEKAKIVRGVNPALDAEAIRVVNSLPDWKPGQQHGVAVDVAYTMPIEFMLQ